MRVPWVGGLQTEAGVCQRSSLSRRLQRGEAAVQASPSRWQSSLTLYRAFVPPVEVRLSEPDTANSTQEAKPNKTAAPSL